MSRKVTLRLTVDVTYSPNSTKISALKAMLKDIPRLAAGEGLMTGCTDAEVDKWSSKIEETNGQAEEETK